MHLIRGGDAVELVIPQHPRAAPKWVLLGRRLAAGAVALLELLTGAAGARGVAAHVGERVSATLAVHLDAAAFGRRRVLEVLRTARCQGRWHHGLRTGRRYRVGYFFVVLGRLRCRVRPAAP